MKSVSSSVTFGALAVSSVAAYRGIPLSHVLPKEPRGDSTLQAAPECVKSCVTSSNCRDLSMALENCVVDQCEDEHDFDGVVLAYSACASLFLNETMSSIVDTVNATSTETSSSLATLSTTTNATSTPADFVRRGDKWQSQDFWTITGTKATPSWPTWGLNHYFGPAKATQNSTIVITLPTTGWPGPPVPTILRRQDNGTIVTTSVNVSFTETSGTVTSVVLSPTTTTSSGTLVTTPVNLTFTETPDTVTSTLPSPTTTTTTITRVSGTTVAKTSLPQGSATGNSSSNALVSPSSTPGPVKTPLQPRDLTVTALTPTTQTTLVPFSTTTVTDSAQISSLLRASKSLAKELDSVWRSYTSVVGQESSSALSSLATYTSAAGQDQSSALGSLATEGAQATVEVINGPSSPSSPSSPSATSDGSLPSLSELVMTVCVVTGAAMGFGFMLSA